MPMHERLIVVANRTCPCPGLPDEVAKRITRTGQVHVVAPALNSRLRHYTSDVDEAVEQAGERLGQAVTALRDSGMAAEGSVGDSDPLVAIADLLAEFDADGVLISTWPEGSSNWLEKDLPGRAREQLDIPVDHLVSPYDAPPAGAEA